MSGTTIFTVKSVCVYVKHSNFVIAMWYGIECRRTVDWHRGECSLFIQSTSTVVYLLNIQIPVMNEVPVFTKIDREEKEGREDERKGKKGGTDSLRQGKVTGLGEKSRRKRKKGREDSKVLQWKCGRGQKR